MKKQTGKVYHVLYCTNSSDEESCTILASTAQNVRENMESLKDLKQIIEIREYWHSASHEKLYAVIGNDACGNVVDLMAKGSDVENVKRKICSKGGTVRSVEDVTECIRMYADVMSSM